MNPGIDSSGGGLGAPSKALFWPWVGTCFVRATGKHSRVASCKARPPLAPQSSVECGFPMTRAHTPIGRAIARLLLGVATLLAVVCPRASALDPSLDVSQYAHTAWRSRDGFPFIGGITGIGQTPDGYLWLATELGTLLRFDGLRTVAWQPPIHKHVASILTARDGALWIGSEGGLASWKNGTLTEYKQFEGYYVAALSEDRDGTLWAGIAWDPGGRVCAVRTGTVQCYGMDGSLGRYVRSLCDDGDRLWVYAESGLWQWKPAPAPVSEVQKPQSWDLSRMSCTNDEGHSLIAIPGGVKEVVSGKLVPTTLPNSPDVSDPTAMFRDRNGGLWIGTANRGLIHVHEGRTDRFTRSDGLSGNHVRILFEDREGNVWVVTSDGLDRFREFAFPSISVNQGLATNEVWSVLAARDGSVWAGSSHALHRWKNGQIIVYPKGHGLGDYPGSLFEDDRGRIWISTSHGLTSFSNGRFTSVSQQPTGQVHSITEDTAGRLWFSEDSEGRQSIGSVLDGRVVERIPRSRLGLKESAIILSADPFRGGLWIGAKDALAYFKDGSVQKSYTGADGLPSGDVNDIHVDGQGTVWAATDGGLVQLKDGRLATLTTDNGLPCSGVSWVREDDDHWFWLYLQCGLARIRRSELESWAADTKRKVTATVFDNPDGVQVRWNPSYGYGPIVSRSKDGKLWFVNLEGVSVIDPRRLSYNQLPPPVHIEQIAANGKVYWQNLTGAVSSKLHLPPRIRDLEIEFTAMRLAVPERVRFRYKLEGQDPDWKEVINARKVQYSNLAPGNYRFRVIASNNSGVWDGAGDTLDFVVAPAYYQTNWFRALCAAVFLGLLWAAYQLRIRQLRREEGKLRDVVETIPTFAWTALPDGSVDFVNRNWLVYTGLSTEKSVGSGWEAAIHPEDVGRNREKWLTSMETGEPFENELRYQSANGQYRWFLERAVPLRHARGKIVKWCGISTDVEDRKRAGEALRRSEAYLAEAQRLTHTGSWAYTAGGEALYWSEENFRIWGFDPQEGPPDLESMRQRVHLEDRDRVRANSNNAVRAKTDFVNEFRIVLPDGTVRHIHAVGHPVLSASGEVIEVVGTHVDVTDRKRAEELQADLAHINRVTTMGELAASLSHELKQPIAAAIMNAKTCLRWLKREQPDLEEACEATDRIVQDGNRAAEIIDRLRSLYKKSPPKRELVEVNDIVREMVVLLRGEANRYGVSIRADLAEDLPKITADRVQLQQVLMNLMLNAIEAMKETGGVLTVTSQLDQDGRVLISVSDTGEGLPAEKADQIFNAFFTTKSQGSGMGLAISRSIIESHGGRLWATANSGRGATFHFSLPTAAQEVNVPAMET